MSKYGDTLAKLVKNGYNNCSKEDQEVAHHAFSHFIVRHELSENNKQLQPIFKTKHGNKSAYNQSAAAAKFGYTDFNNAFFGVHLSQKVSNEEQVTDLLKNMTKDEFNDYLLNCSFEKQIALIYYSGRPQEKIIDRLPLETKIAYANMQALFITNYEKTGDYDGALKASAMATRINFNKEHGREYSDFKILKQAYPTKNPGSKILALYSTVLNHENYKLSEAMGKSKEEFDLVVKRLAPTKNMQNKLNFELSQVKERAFARYNSDLDDRRRMVYKNPEDPDAGFTDIGHDQMIDEFYSDNSLEDYEKLAENDIYYDLIRNHKILILSELEKNRKKD